MGDFVMTSKMPEDIEKLLDERDAKLREYADKEIDSLRTETIVAFELFDLDKTVEIIIAELNDFSSKKAREYFMNHSEELSIDSYNSYRQNHKAYNFPRKELIGQNCKMIMSNANRLHDKAKTRLTDTAYKRVRAHVIQIIKETGIEWHDIIPDMTIEEWKD